MGEGIIKFNGIVMAGSSLFQGQSAWLLLGIGFALLSVALLVLMLSRLGHARPVQKCVILSVYAHLLLLVFAYMYNLFQVPLPSGHGQTTSVTYIESNNEEDQMSGDTPWEQSQPIKSEESPPQINPETIPVEVAIPDPTFVDDALLSDSEQITSELLESASVADAEVLESTFVPQPEKSVATTDPLVKSPTQLEPEDTAALPDATAQTTTDGSDNDLQSLADVVPISEDADLAADPTDRTLAQLASSSSAKSPPIAAASPAITAPRRVLPKLYRDRQGDDRLEKVVSQGGSRETEQAVKDALVWLASAQNPRDGRWNTEAWGGGRETRDFSNVGASSRTIHADTALTGLALLCFFGAGHTHLDGPYQEHIDKGLQFLFSQQSASNGSLAGNAGPFVAMYCHGIATLALSEASIMTRDKRIRPHLEGAIHYTISSQHRTTGGWRYKPGDTGDTSQFGWQLMSLISARSAGIEIPIDTWRGANQFLEYVSLGQHGGLACYNPAQKRATHTMTAEALMCRIFLQGSRSQAAIEEGANYISQYGLGQAPTDLYYFYYATLALHQLQDYRWTAWNKAVSRKLVGTQRTDDGQLKGSWDPDTRWGRAGGRVYTTALATLCLESYYRYLPFYRSQLKTATRGIELPSRR